ncbi:hypothetical protein [Sorangium sp. So ce362]|uniref:hypothetical protein n=1 Tax=Sorangium sp. So ce362 TaxID=3133303 RepID=UPI003F62CBE7
MGCAYDMSRLQSVTCHGWGVTCHGWGVTCHAPAGPADGLILDMRGFPGINLAEVAQRVIPGPWSGAIFRVAMHTGPDDVSIDELVDTFGPLDSPAYGGPLVLLVGNGTLSAAEHFSLARRRAPSTGFECTSRARSLCGARRCTAEVERMQPEARRRRCGRRRHRYAQMRPAREPEPAR